MNRLRDEGGDDPVAVRGIEILRGTPPTPRMPEMKRRVWLAQQQRATRRADGFRLSRLRVGAVVAGAILCLAGTSGAVIAARRWIVPALREVSHPAPKMASRTVASFGRTRTGKESAKPVAPAGEPAPAHDEIAGRTAVALGAPAASGTTPVTTEGATTANKASAASASTSARTSRGAGARRTAAVASGTRLASTPVSGRPARVDPPLSLIAMPLPTTTASALERGQVLDAMIALRRDHDAVSAGAMLHRYLTSHPNGALREEALVLAIEAASARGDLALVKSLARAYDDAYPKGRFGRYAQDQAAAAGRS